MPQFITRVVGNAAVILLAFCAVCANAGLITVPTANTAVEGNVNNAFPFNSSIQRYQQIYSSSEFSSGGIISDIRFRVDDIFGSSFSTSGIDVRIDLAYAATTPSTPSSIFANNIGSGLVTVLNTTNLTLSGTGGSSPNPFDIVIDVADLFSYNPSSGDLLLDIYMGNSSTFTTQFDAVTNSSLARIYTLGSGGLSGFLGAGFGLVTQFNFIEDVEGVPEPASLALFGLGLAGLGWSRRKRA